MPHDVTPDGLHLLTGGWGALGVEEIGATVVSWRPGCRERLYTASDALVGAERMWHGGIPVCAPWFGVGNGGVPFIHGLTPKVRWRTLEVTADEGRAHIVLVTDAQVMSHLPGAERFPSDLRYELDVVADATTLTLGLTIASPSREATVEMALHPYLLTDARHTRIAGLGGVAYHDFAVGLDGVGEERLAVARHLDRVYTDAPPTTLSDGSSTLRLAAQGANSVVVWNPGPDNDQVPGEEWADFVCLEYADVKSGTLTIPAGSSHLLRLSIIAD